MAGRRYSSQVASDVTVTTTTEQVVATVVVAAARAGARIQLAGWVQITLGTNTTAVTCRVRRGTTIADTLIGEANPAQISSAAGSTEEHEVSVEDTPTGEVASQSYVLTVQQTGASANGSVLQAHLDADVDF